MFLASFHINPTMNENARIGLWINQRQRPPSLLDRFSAPKKRLRLPQTHHPPYLHLNPNPSPTPPHPLPTLSPSPPSHSLYTDSDSPSNRLLQPQPRNHRRPALAPSPLHSVCGGGSGREDTEGGMVLMVGCNLGLVGGVGWGGEGGGSGEEGLGGRGWLGGGMACEWFVRKD